MKLLIRFKGGTGSGFHGHVGRPGKVGGSISGKGGTLYNSGDAVTTEQAILDVLRAIRKDKKLYNLVLASEADGVHPIGENVWFLEKIKGAQKVLGEVSEEGALGEYTVRNRVLYNKINEELNGIYRDAEIAKSEEGWFDPENTGKDPDRQAWEEKYYGKKVGGHANGDQYAIEILESYTEELISGSNILQPKKARQVYTDPVDIFYKKKYPFSKTINFEGKKWKVTVQTSSSKLNTEHAVVIERVGSKPSPMKPGIQKVVTIEGNVVDVPKGKSWWTITK